MNISFIVPEINKTGGMRVIFEYANRLSLKGHRVTLYSPYIPFNYFKGMFKPYFIKYRIRYALGFLRGTRKPPDIFGERFFNIKYSAFINNRTVENADAVIATSWPTAFAVNRLKQSKGKKFYFIQDYEVWHSNRKYTDKSYRLGLTKITVSKYLKDLLKSKFNEDSIEILNGLDYKTFSNDAKDFNKKNKQVLFMDHSLENKNVKAAIAAAERLHITFPGLSFACFGYNNYNSLPSYVNFIKNPSDETIANLYKNSDIFLFTSLYEGFGLPPAEAMACKCAVVGNAVAALPEYSVNGESAILVEPSDPDGVYKGAEFLLNNPAELKRISVNGSIKIREVLNWERSVSEFEKVLIG